MKAENWTQDRLKIEYVETGKLNYLLIGTLPHGERIRKKFLTEELAKVAKQKIITDLGNTIERYTELTLDQEEEYKLAQTLIEKSDRLPEGFTIIQAVEFAKLNYRPEVAVGVTIKEATQKWASVLTDAGRSDKYINDQTTVGQKLGEAFGHDHPVAAITTEDVRNFLSIGPDAIGPWKGKVLAPITRFNHRHRLSLFFNFCREMKYIIEKPLNKTIKVPEIPQKNIEILSHQEVEDLFEACKNIRPEITIPYFALAIFGGLRPQELCHPKGKAVVEWDKFIIRPNGEDCAVEVTGEVGKTVERRIVDLPENCIKWLRPYIQEHGPVIPLCYEDWRVLYDCVRCHAGYKINIQEAKRFDKNIKEVNDKNTKSWVQDVCRHTALTYYYEKVRKNKWIAADWAGNRPEVYASHYNSKVKGTLEQTAKEIVADFYAIEPGPSLAA